ncbi:MAG: flagellar basal body P-ring formation chaperone FlgA [Steroidobacteraceae bacterium]
MKQHASTIRRRDRSWASVWLAAIGLCAAGLAVGAIQPVASIRQAAEQFVQGQMPSGEQGVVVTAGRLDSRLRLPRCGGSLEAALLSGARLAANMSVAVGCHTGADWTIYVPVSIQSRIHVWALRQPESAGARLTAADLLPETRLVSGVAAGYVTNLAELGRSSLRHPMPAGAVLHSGDLLADFMVRQGQSVTLVASIGGIQVRASGIALQDGRYGAVIRVQNPTSKRVVQGTVGGSHVVYVSP